MEEKNVTHTHKIRVDESVTKEQIQECFEKLTEKIISPLEEQVDDIAQLIEASNGNIASVNIVASESAISVALIGSHEMVARAIIGAMLSSPKHVPVAIKVWELLDDMPQLKLAQQLTSLTQDLEKMIDSKSKLTTESMNHLMRLFAATEKEKS